MDLNRFIDSSIAIHGHKYDYSLSEYINHHTKLQILCSIHGVFLQSPATHLRGSGCPKCFRSRVSLDNSEFIGRCKLKHGDKYDYSSTIYVSAKTLITVICRSHGAFKILPNDHCKRGGGCPLCYDCTKINSTDRFIAKATQVHHGKYDYSLSQFVNDQTPVIIICPIHGPFLQRKRNHLNGAGCHKCAKESCLAIHGSFRQKVNNHLQGQGCPSCPISISKPQQEIIEYIQSIIKDEILINDRKALNGLECDIYISKHKLAIEFHGLYWHSVSYNGSSTLKTRHHNKAIEAMKLGIDLIQIFENQWAHQKDLVKSIIKHKLGLSNKLYARSCEVDYDLDTSDFFRLNHLQSDRPASYNVCLLYKSEIVGACSYSRHPKYDFELIRMAFKKDCAIVGGVSKLIKHFKLRTDHSQLFTYANLCYSNAKGYLSSGFDTIGYSKPGYFYYHESSKSILSRYQCQKHKLHKILASYDESLSETVNMFNNGYRKVYDAGHMLLLNQRGMKL